MSIFSELKRRNVFRIGVAYLIVAWLLMQVAALAVPALRLPEWVTTFVVFILSLGFPIALLLAWAFEVTPEGIRKTKDVPLERSVRNLTGQRLNYAVIVLLAIAVIVLLVERSSFDSGTPVAVTAEISVSPSLAVLPFDNMSDDPEQEHFADGLTEELLNSLATIDDLRLVSRTSSFAFKGSELALADIADQLGVAHILEGSVRRAGDTIRITAQLIEAGSDSHLWSQTYDRNLSVENIFDIQEEVAEAVARTLHASLRTADQSALSMQGPASIEAFDYYLEGMRYVRRLETGEARISEIDEFHAAVEAFEASIRLDPDWAPSHAGLGRVHHFWKDIDFDNQLRLAREHVMKAIELDESYGPAWASLGYIETMTKNYDAAFDAYNRASTLGAGSNWGRAILLQELGRYDQSVEEFSAAAQWDPMSLPVRLQRINMLYCVDRIPELVSAAQKLVDDHPERLYPRAMLSYALVRNGDRQKGLDLANEIAASTGSDHRVLEGLAAAGEQERVLSAIREIEGTELWWDRAAAAALIGEEELALDILESVESDPNIHIEIFRCSPQLRALAGNPRYDALVERLELPE